MEHLFKTIDDKKVPIVPSNKNETYELSEEIRELSHSYVQNLYLWGRGNKTAGKRARVTMYALVKLSPVLNKAMLKTDKGEW